jgi:hypothetical protein
LPPLGNVDIGGGELIGVPANSNCQAQTARCHRLERGAGFGDALGNVQGEDDDASREHQPIGRRGEERRRGENRGVVAVITVMVLTEPERIEASVLGAPGVRRRLLEEVPMAERSDVGRLHGKDRDADSQWAGGTHRLLPG